ncbi:hypothetical protein DNTS_016668 [Danionella cerebrum]|uniref:Uncharacterized protein n=1 Tax=Danionella cerebrum TaxID=2873325 RepID=A0A553RFS5_9TELE|nr:hypothetical protein DNTS_016668 [Danionella translucida]
MEVVNRSVSFLAAPSKDYIHLIKYGEFMMHKGSFSKCSFCAAIAASTSSKAELFGWRSEVAEEVWGHKKRCTTLQRGNPLQHTPSGQTSFCLLIPTILHGLAEQKHSL